jgi:uncharacterized protein with HEPN domain
MSPEEKLRLTHIAEAAALIARYVEGISKREFSEDTLRQDAVIRRIQAIQTYCEDAKKLHILARFMCPTPF